MSEGKVPPMVRDMVGNEIVKDMLVTIQMPFPVIYKVIAVSPGGIHTVQGKTPAVIRVVSDVTLGQPEPLFKNILKIALPMQEKVIESIADLLAKS